MRLAFSMLVEDLEAGVAVPPARVFNLSAPNEARDLFVFACVGPPSGAGGGNDKFHYVREARASLNPPQPRALAANAALREGGRSEVFKDMAKAYWSTAFVRLGGARVHGLVLRFQKHCTALVVHLINAELSPLADSVAAGYFSPGHLAAMLPGWEQWSSLQHGAAHTDLASLFFSRVLGITHATPRGGGAKAPLLFSELSEVALEHPALRGPLVAYQRALWGLAGPPLGAQHTGASFAALLKGRRGAAPAPWRRVSFLALLSRVQQSWRTNRGLDNADNDVHPGERGLHEDAPHDNHELLPQHEIRGATYMDERDFYPGWRAAGGGGQAGGAAPGGVAGGGGGGLAEREPFSLHPCGNLRKFFPRAFSTLPVADLQVAPFFQVSQRVFSAMVGPTLKKSWLAGAGNLRADFPFTKANGGVPLEAACFLCAGARDSVLTDGRAYHVLYQRLPRRGGGAGDGDSDSDEEEGEESEGEGGGSEDGGSQGSNPHSSAASARSGGSGGGGGGGAPPPPPPALQRAQAFTDNNRLVLLTHRYLAGNATRTQMLRGGREGILHVGADPGANYVLVASATVPGCQHAPLVHTLTAASYYHSIDAVRRGRRTNALWAPLAAAVSACFAVPTRTGHGGQLRASLRNRVAHAAPLLARAQTITVRRHVQRGARLRAGAMWRFWAAIFRACGGLGVPGVAYGNAWVGNVRGHAPGPWRELMHVCARANAHGYTARLWEWLTSRVHSVCLQRMATVYGPWFSGGRGWVPQQPLPRPTARVGGMFWCECCSVFVARDADATFSMRDIDIHYLRRGERLAAYTPANRAANPAHFHIAGSMRGVPARLQFVVDRLPVGGQALIAWAMGSNVLRELLLRALVAELARPPAH